VGAGKIAVGLWSKGDGGGVIGENMKAHGEDKRKIQKTSLRKIKKKWEEQRQEGYGHF